MADRRIEADNENEVALLIDGQRFRFWTSVEINLNFDNIHTFAVSAPFEPDVDIFKNTFKPVSYKECLVYVGGELLITGVMLPVNPSFSSDSNTLSIGGYSKPGILNDVNVPFDKYPLEFNNQDLKQIAITMAGYFDIQVEFDGSQGAIFERVAVEPEQNIFNFLVELAKQRGFVLSNTIDGKLLFRKSKSTGTSIAALHQGQIPLLSASQSIDAQKYYSSITGLSQTKAGKNSESITIQNPHLQDINRPMTFQVQDASGADLQKAVNAKMGRMFGDVAPVSVSVHGWRVPNGGTWRENEILKLLAPRAMIYKETDYLIRSVALKRDGSGDTASMNLVFPESYIGGIPEALPWD